MAGLNPARRSREELISANEHLLKLHRDYLEAWVAQDISNSMAVQTLKRANETKPGSQKVEETA